MTYFYDLAQHEQNIRPLNPSPLVEEFVNGFSEMVNRFAEREMRDEPMSAQEIEDYASEIALDNWKADESERAYYRQRELDLFFEWERDELDDLICRDPSEAYEAFHERRLALNLTEDQVAEERKAFILRQETPVAVCDLF